MWVRHLIAALAVSLPLFACAGNNADYTPQIRVAPGVSERFAWMMRVRRSGEGNVHRALLDGIETRKATKVDEECEAAADECIVVTPAADATENEDDERDAP